VVPQVEQVGTIVDFVVVGLVAKLAICAGHPGGDCVRAGSG
jgi:hypothetical protein